MSKPTKHNRLILKEKKKREQIKEQGKELIRLGASLASTNLFIKEEMNKWRKRRKKK